MPSIKFLIGFKKKNSQRYNGTVESAMEKRDNKDFSPTVLSLGEHSCKIKTLICCKAISALERFGLYRLVGHVNRANLSNPIVF